MLFRSARTVGQVEAKMKNDNIINIYIKQTTMLTSRCSPKLTHRGSLNIWVYLRALLLFALISPPCNLHFLILLITCLLPFLCHMIRTTSSPMTTILVSHTSPFSSPLTLHASAELPLCVSPQPVS